MGMAVGGSQGGPKSDINVTPLVDVCLVLLITFMVMLPMNVPEISVRIPPESKRPPNQRDSNEALVIGLDEDGGLTLNRTPIAKDLLGETLRKQLEFREKKAIFVDFDDEAKYGIAVEILDLAKRSGAEVLGIMKKRDRKTPDNLHGV